MTTAHHEIQISSPPATVPAVFEHRHEVDAEQIRAGLTTPFEGAMAR